MKYELTNETKTLKNGTILHRICALKSFSNIKKEDLGGWIESEENLSQIGNCWVYDEAQVYDEARVSDAAMISGRAWVYGKSQVFGKSWVSGEARVSSATLVYGEARVSGKARLFGKSQVSSAAQVYGEARVSGKARLFGEARVCGKAIATKEVININGTYYNITITDNYLKVGCENHPFDYWLNLKDKDFVKMDGKDAINFAKKWKPILQNIIDLRK